MKACKTLIGQKRIFIDQGVEGFNAAHLGWGSAGAKDVTFSFWLKATKTGTFACRVIDFASSFSYVTELTVSNANTWQKFTHTIPGPTSGTFNTDNSAAFTIGITPSIDTSWIATSTLDTWQSGNFTGSTTQDDLLLNAGDKLWMTGVQLEPGPVATPFEHRPYGTELALCQRYYQSFTSSATETMRVSGSQHAAGGLRGSVFYPVTMRATPTTQRIGNYADMHITYYSSGTTVEPTGLNFIPNTNAMGYLQATATGESPSADNGKGGEIVFKNGAGFALDAEL